MKTYEIIYKLKGDNEEMTLRFEGYREDLINTLKYMKNYSSYNVIVNKIYSVNKNEIYTQIVSPIKF